MIEYKKGNLLDVQTGIIAHGCNCQGVMGSGVALAIKNKYPKAYYEYLAVCEGDNRRLLGTNNYVLISNDLHIVNMFTQFDYGREFGKRYVSYDAVDSCFQKLQYTSKTVNIPKIGSGLGGGDWGVIESIIRNQLQGFNVVVWEL